MTADPPPAHLGRNTARRIVPLFRPYRARVAVVVGLIVLTSTIGIVNPLLIQAVFNKALFVRGGPKLDLLYILVAIMAAVPIVNGAIGILQTYETTKVGQQVIRDLRDRLYSHLQTLSLAFFTSTKTGEIQSRLANDVGGVESVVTTTASLAKVFGNQVRDTSRYRRENQRLSDLEVRQQMIGQGFYAVVQSFLSITPAAIYLIAGLLLAAHHLIPDDSLRGVSFGADPGQLVALVGPSGAGKTTISYLIPRLYDVTGGSVEIDGLDVRQVRQASLAAAIGFVTQESYLFHDSILANISYGRPAATLEEVEEAARAAYIHDRIMEFPDGYDTIVGERGYRLSGGEKQRLAIARVLLHDPRILILDEATSALDTASEREVQKALDALMGSRTTIAIAHRLSTIVNADVINVIDGGRVTESGTHQALLREGGLYASLYNDQFEGGRVHWRCADGDVMADGTVRERATQPA